MTAFEHLILEAEKSPELVAAFRLLAEASDGGEPRFSREACRAVARVVSCRTYATALLELCHLVRAASACRGGYVDFFWGMPGPLRASRFKGLFSRCPPSGAILRPHPGEIELVYRDGTFSIAYGRMIFLCAVMEFLVTTIGFADLDDILAPLARPTATKVEISEQANSLSRLVYAYLKDHLPPLQTQRKVAAMIDFLTARNDGDFDPHAIDDRAVLDFWLASVGGAEDFRTFTSVFLAFARLRQVVAQAEVIGAIEQARPIGSSIEDGEVDPGEIETVVEAMEDQVNPFERLAEAPASHIKFFNARERGAMAFLFQCGRAADDLPLSFARCEVFGPAQSLISQSLRSGVPRGDLAATIEASCREDYMAHQRRLADLAAHGWRVLLASVHVLHGRDGAMTETLVRLLRPDLRLAGEMTADVVPFRRKSVPDPSMDKAEEERPNVERFLAEARMAAKGLARQGFRPDEWEDATVVEGFIAGAPLVAEVVIRLEGVQAHLGRLALPTGTWDQQFETDRATFTAGFRRIYGVPE
ncbi:MAG: hypothetical protein HQL33_01865 [Alphaproteobacteria bacterium]|nr:hypothetical protein [Alphaproteobacteria bacterium]